ncbi:hypothetical protein MGN70_013860 [Eutypa lata]|nr:hypothetical protein MGN70_013860 [Eutypa lata]
MCITLEVYAQKNKEDGERVRCHREKVDIKCHTPAKDLGHKGEGCVKQHINITRAHPLLDELEYDLRTRFIPSYKEGEDYAELVGGTGIGASIKEDRTIETTMFKDLRTLMDAYWDYYGIGPKVLNTQLEELRNQEKIIKDSFVDRVKGLGDLKRIKKERKEIDDKREELRNRVKRAEQSCGVERTRKVQQAWHYLLFGSS